MTTVRTRFAPSPTGYLHVGGLRTALYSYLFAKQNGGQFLLRVEDTDRERYVEDSIPKIIAALYWAGIAPDEGVMLENGSVVQKGSHGPYIQSERLEIYGRHIKTLLENGSAYYCFCTSERLAELRDMQQKNKLPTGYDGHCRALPAEEVAKHLEAKEKHVVRLKMPKEGNTTFTDLIKGQVVFKNELIDDQVLMKSDGFPTYHFAVVVDDHEMQITHVIRGDEWVNSIPKHLEIYQSFGWAPPAYAHLPLLLNTDKSKLSKRQGDVAVTDYASKGYLPGALVNFIAFLGWNPGTDKELYTLEELVKDFSLEKVSKSGAVFNVDKLDWFNKEYIKKLSPSDLFGAAIPWLRTAGLAEDTGSAETQKKFEKILALERERVTTLAELPSAVKFMFELPDYQKEKLVWRKGSLDEVKKILPEIKDFLGTCAAADWAKTTLEQKIGDWIKEKGYSTGSVLWPLRVALSGQENSPGPYEIAEALGRAESLGRLDKAIAKL